jgi:WD40 repeat protein
MKRQRFSALATAVLLAAGLIVVLSMAAVLTYLRPKTTTTTGISHTSLAKTATPIPTPTQPAIMGQTLYTTPPDQQGFSAISWSPDSKRIASLASDVQMWDATTGQHLVKVQLPGVNEWATGLSWSPNSQVVAITTNQEMLIANGQTGQIVHLNSAKASAMAQPISTGKAFLSSRFPASGGQGYHSPVWSPDGRFLATVVVSSTTFTGEVQVWNTQTGYLAYTLQVDSGYNLGALSWSSDGQYLASSKLNNQMTNPMQPTGSIIVWNVSTRQPVFQHQDYLDSSVQVAWQPHSDTIAFKGVTASGNDLIETLELWDVLTGKQVKQYPRIGSDALAWSPDGKYLVYNGYDTQSTVRAIILLDVNTNKPVYAYTGFHNDMNVSVLSWSPNGKYIAAGQGNSRGNMVAKIWVA